MGDMLKEIKKAPPGAFFISNCYIIMDSVRSPVFAALY
jgi:hypothetical protein